MKDIFHPIQNENLLTFSNLFEKKVYYSEANLFYEQHVPNVAYLLLEGMVLFGKKNKILKSIEGSGLIGIKNLYQKTPSKFSASIKPNSTVLIIDRSTLFKVVDKKTFLNNYLFT
jgi:signal-transduction protein with cAMP-binding, CBS, and nucleotidyltransferase domain